MDAYDRDDLERLRDEGHNVDEIFQANELTIFYKEEMRQIEERLSQLHGRNGEVFSTLTKDITPEELGFCRLEEQRLEPHQIRITVETGDGVEMVYICDEADIEVRDTVEIRNMTVSLQNPLLTITATAVQQGIFAIDEGVE